MCKICVFAGTTEGRRVTDYLRKQDAEITVCVATEYGGELIEPSERVTVRAGRMDGSEMEAFFRKERFSLVIDATHPYASAVSENLTLACRNSGTEVLRLERAGECALENAVLLPDIPTAVGFLSACTGNILLTTGSKDIAAFAGISGFSERVFARVLPMESSVTACRDAGLLPSHILAMQGPFSREMNEAMIRSVGAAYVVTKLTGREGGFGEKASAADAAGAKLVVIGRPATETDGISFRELKTLLEKRFGFSFRPEVALIGIGTGTRQGMTGEALEAVSAAECLIGAKRMLAAARPDQTVFEAVSSDEIVSLIRENTGFSRFAVLFSGDTGFFSGAKKLLPKLGFCDLKVVPGISSLSYLCAKAGCSYEDAVCVSLHGREASIVPAVRRNRLVFALVGGENGAGRMIRELSEAGLGHVRITVGERLGYAEEQIVSDNAEVLADSVFDPLSAVLIENQQSESACSGLPDEAFLRNAADKPVVPMTKSEVRAVVMSKLRLNRDSVCWDIGAGTGSVSIEMALAADRGEVFAVEKKAEAVDLLKENIRAFGVRNVTVVPGGAPEACADLPAPTHAFIGGSSGNMREILDLLIRKNPRVRIVAAAISLETVSELSSVLKDMDFRESETVCLNVSKSRPVGGYHLMTGQNPVYVFTLQ